MPLTPEEQSKGYVSLMNEVVDPKTSTVIRRYTNPPPVAVGAATPAPAAPVAPTSYNNNPILSRPTGPVAVDESTIREETRKRMQTQIDAINAEFANLISREQVAGEDRSGQTRAINARSGLAGSDFGQAQATKTQQFNQQQVKALEDEKAAKVGAILANIEDRASAEIQRHKQEALGKYQMDMAEFEKAQESARADLKTLAQSGVNLEQLNPAQRAALFKQSGYDENMGELIYNAMKPQAQKIDYKFEKLADGRGMFYGVDPVTGELKTVNVEVDLPPDWQMQIAPDGTVLGYDKNTGQAKVLSDKGAFGDPLEQALKQAQIEKIYSDIANGDSDGLLSVEEASKLGVPFGTTKGQAVGVIPGSVEKIEKAETALSNTTNILSLIEALKNHPGLDGATGLFGARINLFGNSRDFVAKFDQLKANLSLENISKLKGTGAISDAEQMLLANAASALRRDGDKDKLIEELDRLEKNLKATQSKLQNIINVGAGSTIDEFEAQYNGGSEGTNPKAPGSPQAFSPTISRTLASTLSAKFPEGSIGQQCGEFVRKVATQFGLTYPRLGDSLTEKISAVKKHGTQLSNARIGSVIVTKENPTYGHVAWIIGKNDRGYIVAESNFKQNEKVSYGRVIPFNSSKIVGVINPKTA
jgi:hypothetical protein